MSDATFACPDLTTFCRLDELGLEVTGQRLEPDRAVLALPGRGAAMSGAIGAAAWANPATRWCAGWPTSRSGGGPRSCWSPSGATAAQNAITCGVRTLAKAAARRSKLSRRGAGAGRWKALVVAHLTVARVAEGLGVAWGTANDAVLDRRPAGPDRRPAPLRRRDGDRGRRARVAPHPPRGQVRHGDHRPDPASVTAPAPPRLLDMVEGRSKKAFKDVAGRAPAGLARQGGSGGDGRVHRVQDRRRPRNCPTPWR